MKAKLKVPRPGSRKKDNLPDYRVLKKTKKITLSSLMVGVYKSKSRKKSTKMLVSR
jgi:hypothetical protein